MSQEPLSFFAGLTRGCIRDEYMDDGSVLRDSVIFTFLGIASGILTVYALSMLGFFV